MIYSTTIEITYFSLTWNYSL